MNMTVSLRVQSRTDRSITLIDHFHHKYWPVPPLLSHIECTRLLRERVPCEWDKLTPGRQVSLTFQIDETRLSVEDILRHGTKEEMRAFLARIESENKARLFRIKHIEAIHQHCEDDKGGWANWQDYRLKLYGGKRLQFHFRISDRVISKLTKDRTHVPTLILRSIDWNKTQDELKCEATAHGFVLDEDHVWVKPGKVLCTPHP